FSSRRRHTRCYRDWSSDVCSSDLIKAFFIVNPGNPTGVALSKETIGKIANLVKTKRPDLMLLTDDVYGTFVPDFRSLLGELPYKIGRASCREGEEREECACDLSGE